MEKTEATLHLLLDAHKLKRTYRTGWVARGISNAESVAEHSFGVTFIALLLMEMIDHPLDKNKVLTIALLHDLPEGITGDIPSPAVAHFPPNAKRDAELAVLKHQLNNLPHADQWRDWWQEFEDRSSPEGRLVRDADKLDMLIQAYTYEQTTSNRWLEEFWPLAEDGPQFEFPAAQAIYESLITLRENTTL